MAEIKTYKKAQVFNQPVGVVRSTGAEAASRAWAGVATAGQRIFEMGYQEAKVQQKALGDSFAKMSVIGRDDQGNYEAVELPATFSPVARQTAELGLQENYVKQFALDATNAGKVLYGKYKERGDTAGFLGDWEAATSGQIKAVSQDPKLAKYAPVMQQMMDNVGKEHVASLHSIAYDLADRKAYQNDTELLNDGIANLLTLASTDRVVEVPSDGDLEPSYAPAGQVALEQTLEAIDRLGEKYASRIEVGTVPKLKKEARTAFHSGQISRIISRLKEIVPPPSNPNSNNDVLGDIMQAGVTVFSTGSLDAVDSPSVRATLEAAGLNDAFFQQEGIGELRAALGNEFSKAQSRQAESFNKFKDDYKVAAVSNNLDNGAPVGKDDAALLLREGFGVTNATDLANNFERIINSKQGQNLLLYNTVAPDVVKDFLSPDFAKTFLQQNPQALPTALNFFRQATLSQNGTVRAARGIDVKTVQFWEELNAYSKSGQTMSMDQFLEAESALQEGGALVDSSIQNRIYEFTGKESKGLKAALEDFTLQAVGNDPDMAVFFGSQAKRLIYVHGADKAMQIIKNTKDKIFIKSDFMYDKDRPSLFAPEMFYKGVEMDVFRSTIATRLRTAENGSTLVLGKNVGLVADRRGTPPVGGIPTRLPTYTLRYTSGDRIGQPVRDANGPIEIGPQAIISARATALRMSEADWMAAWKQSYDMRFGATDKLGRVKRPPSGATFNYSTRFKTIDDARKAAAEAGK
jgi:hypothetical protein